MTYNKYFIVGGLCVLSLLLGTMGRNRATNELSNHALCQDCNVVVIGLDALQAAHVSHLGNAIETTPTLDGLAKQGTSFGNAISPASWTVPAFMSIMTSLYPSEHNVVNKFSTYTKEEQVVSNLKKLSPDVQTLAEVFKANGYVTGGFTGDSGVSGAFGYKQGFDVYTDEKAFGSIGNSSEHALTWIETNKDKKLFIFLHGYDDHGQYDLPDNYKGRFEPANYTGAYKGTEVEQRTLRELGLANGSIYLNPNDVAFWRSWYDSKIRDQDDRLAKFLADYDKLGLTKKTIFVVVSDHGTEFYEHKRVDHGFSLYDELIHVPFVFVVPGLAPQNIIKDQVTTLDLAPTLIDLTGVSAGTQYASQIRGKSLLSYLTAGEGTAQDVFMETDYRNYTHKRGIRASDGWKYIMTMETKKAELYNLNTDPKELTNVVSKYPEKAEELKKKILDHISAMGKSVDGPWPIGCVPVYGDQCK